MNKHFAAGYPDWTNDYHHAGFDIVSNRILEILDKYIKTQQTNFKGDIAFWVTGHSRGAGVANLVGAALVDGKCGGNRDNVYCYTFAAPNTFYTPANKYSRDNTALPGRKIEGEYKEPRGIRYRCIFNIINEDDFVPKLPMKDCGWTRYGRDASDNIQRFHQEKMYQKTINYIEGKPVYNINATELDKFFVNYIGSPGYSDRIDKSFTKVYEGIKDMRSNSYEYDDKDIVVVNDISIEHLENAVNKVSLPYQKLYYSNIVNNEKRIIQKQMPAYFFQTLSGELHTVDNNGEITKSGNKVRFFFTQTAGRYTKAKNTMINNVGALQHPHYLESYYVLTKEITSTDFK